MSVAVSVWSCLLASLHHWLDASGCDCAAGDAVVSRCDGFLRFLDLKQCVLDITGQDQGFGDGSKRAAIVSSYKLNGGEGPGANGGGIDIAKELAMEGITMNVGVKALGHNSKKMAQEAKDEFAAAIAAEMVDRPDASPRPNNLDYHNGFQRVNSNMFLRRVGASLGVVDEVKDASLVTVKGPDLIEGLTN